MKRSTTSLRQHELIANVDYPRGHYKNPMTDEEVNARLRSLAGWVLSNLRVEQALDWLWKLEDAADLDPMFEMLEIQAAPS